MQQTAERENRPDEAKKLAHAADWYEEYLNELRERPEANPYIRAARLQAAYHRRPQSYLTEDDLDTFRGQTVVAAEVRQQGGKEVLRLQPDGGGIVAIEARGNGLDVSDQTSIQ